jgi:hypothetical protein
MNKHAQDILDAWKLDLIPTDCDRCGWMFFTLPQAVKSRCPHCCQSRLAVVEGDISGMLPVRPPELIIPFHLSKQQLENTIQDFSAKIPFAPDDLNPGVLRDRLARLFLPVWLVDSQIHGTWQAQTGFDYQVVSHQEAYDENSSEWKTLELQETRIRWEDRLGKMNRAFENITVPAMQDSAVLLAGLDNFPVESARAYDPECLEQAYVRLPDHTPDEAWKEAEQAFITAATEECRKACSADHMRDFRWMFEFGQVNWTLLLLPVYTTFYSDDDGKPLPLLVHGQTGKMTGTRRASLKKARRMSLFFLISGILLFLFGLLAGQFNGANNFVDGLTMVLVLAGIFCGIGSLYPVITAWDYNRKQLDSE